MDYTIICTAAARAAVNALADSLGNGPNTCSIALHTTQGTTDPTAATHFGGNGPLAPEVAAALRLSLNPTVMVLEQTDGQGFWDHCAAVQTNGVTTPLHPIVEGV